MSDGEKQAELLPFEAWVELSARLNGLDQDDRFDALDAAEVELAVFDRSERHWQSALFSEARAGDKTRMRAYGARCATVMEERRAAPGSPPSGGSAPFARPREVAPAPPVRVQVATFMKDQPLVQILNSLPSDDVSLDTTGEIRLRAEPVLPFVAGTALPVAPKPSPEPPAHPPEGDPLDQTTESHIEDPSVRVLPFRNGEKEPG